MTLASQYGDYVAPLIRSYLEQVVGEAWILMQVNPPLKQFLLQRSQLQIFHLFFGRRPYTVL
jgi:hypothetical protein